jgi:hypothetical protein
MDMKAPCDTKRKKSLIQMAEIIFYGYAHK